MTAKGTEKWSSVFHCGELTKIKKEQTSKQTIWEGSTNTKIWYAFWLLIFY